MANPYNKLLLSKDIQKSFSTVRRIDDKGQLYYMDYNGNYYGAISIPIKAIGLVKKGGCSTFITKTPEGEYISARNYDMPHLNEEKKPYGVNFVLHTTPKGKYESLAGVDSAWLSVLGIKLKPGCFDDNETDLTGLALLPYLCMDGMNEKGFSGSILALDLKDGEKVVSQNAPGKKKIIITMLLRYMLDSCANIEQAVALAKSYNMVNTLGHDYHLFISDASGKAAVLEWRYNELKVIRTDACTNFYVGNDDAQDCIYKDGLKEKWVEPDFTTKREYHFGYGHGYERFKTLIKTLDKHVNPNAEKYETNMTKEESRDLLKAVAQDYDGMLTSYTQYSVLYNHQKLEASYYLQQDYENEYKFSLK